MEGKGPQGREKQHNDDRNWAENADDVGAEGLVLFSRPVAHVRDHRNVAFSFHSELTALGVNPFRLTAS